MTNTSTYQAGFNKVTMAATDRFTTEEDLVMRPERWRVGGLRQVERLADSPFRRDVYLNMKI